MIPNNEGEDYVMIVIKQNDAMHLNGYDFTGYTVTTETQGNGKSR